MSSGKIKKIKFFFEDADCVFFCSSAGVAGARAHFMRLYILFSSFQFNSFQFYSIQHDENYERKGTKTKKTKNIENYEILRKKGKMLLKQSRYRDILYCKCILFYTS